jgi:hypothetical protein
VKKQPEFDPDGGGSRRDPALVRRIRQALSSFTIAGDVDAATKVVYAAIEKLERERAAAARMPVVSITIRGPQGSGKSTIARAIAAMLAEADVRAEISDGDEPRVLTATEIDQAIARRGHQLRALPHLRVQIDMPPPVDTSDVELTGVHLTQGGDRSTEP